jgi:hypothetical protein
MPEDRQLFPSSLPEPNSKLAHYTPPQPKEGDAPHTSTSARTCANALTNPIVKPILFHEIKNKISCIFPYQKHSLTHQKSKFWSAHTSSFYTAFFPAIFGNLYGRNY